MGKKKSSSKKKKSQPKSGASSAAASRTSPPPGTPPLLPQAPILTAENKLLTRATEAASTAALRALPEIAKPKHGDLLFVIAHRMLCIEYFALKKKSRPLAPIITHLHRDSARPDLMETLVHATTIYVDLFYIYFANEFSYSSSVEPVLMVVQSMTHAFQTVKSLVQHPDYELVLLRHQPIKAGPNLPVDVGPNESPVSALLANERIFQQLPPFARFLKSCLNQPEGPSSSDSPGHDTKIGLEDRIDTKGLVHTFRKSKEVKFLRQLLAYLDPHEAKRVMTVAAIKLKEGDTPASESPFTPPALIKNCLSPSVGRANLAYIIDGANPSKDSPDAYTDISPILFADEAEFSNRIRLTRCKTDLLIQQCEEYLNEYD